MGGVTIDGTTQPPGARAPDGSAPVYLSYPAPLPEPPGARRRRRRLFALGALWALVLLASGVWYALHGGHTVREQTTIAQAAPVVDEATAWVLSAAGPGPVAAIGGYTSAGGCDITPVRRGEQWGRAIRLATPPGSERALLERIGAGLPARYAARVHTGDVSSTLYADAGDYVAVSGKVEAPGLVRVAVSTGCRPVPHRPAADPSSAPAGAERAAVEQALRGLGSAATGWAVHELPCGPVGGGRVRTVTATAAAPAGALTAAAAGTAVVNSPELVATRDGTVGTMARRDGDTLTVSATSGTCVG